MSNYSITSKASLNAKIVVMVVFIITTILLVILWGVGWFSALLLIALITSLIYFFSSLQAKPFECLLSDNGTIEITNPNYFVGNISASSFYNAWVIFLCVEEHDSLLIHDHVKHNKSKKWFIVFSDSIDEHHYRLIARLVVSARWA